MRKNSLLFITEGTKFDQFGRDILVVPNDKLGLYDMKDFIREKKRERKKDRTL